MISEHNCRMLFTMSIRTIDQGGGIYVYVYSSEAELEQALVILFEDGTYYTWSLTRKLTIDSVKMFADTVE